MDTTLYDTIGLNYADLRKPDPRISLYVEDALAQASSVLNVGAGTGSYEPANKQITAVEPSAKMIAQRGPSNAAVYCASAENLPFGDNMFDASMACLTIHHWSDQVCGINEMRRVTREKIVFLTYDPSHRGFWLADYFPQLITLDEAQMPPMAFYEKHLGPVDISSIPIPFDCTDGFLAGYWRRPAAYLDTRVRAGMSSFWAMDDAGKGLKKLQADLADGTWNRLYGALLDQQELDCGYRLVQTV